MNLQNKILVTGHTGLVGSSILRKLKSLGYSNILTPSSLEVDLTNQQITEEYFQAQKPEFVFLAAAKVGGIMANTNYPADFIYKNIMIEANIVNSSFLINVKKLIFLGSSCIYPKFAEQPIKEEYLLNGVLEETNEPYAIAKIAGIKMCQSYNKQYGTNYISAMPTNLYGFNDNFDLENSHVLPALLRKFHDAKTNNAEKVILWGDGTPKREFLYVDDLADACIFLMINYNNSQPINVGTGIDISIKDLALMIKKIIGFTGDIVWDISKPKGTPRKLLDVDKISNLGWKYKTSLNDGIIKTYEWYKKSLNKL